MPPTLHFDTMQQELHDLSRQFVLVGVTGTKGKTTTSSLIAHLLNTAGIPAACTTTIETLIPGEQPWPTCKTQRMLLALLKRLQELNIHHVVVEAPSYSLANGLAEVCVFTGAVFTNLGQEHLNIHRDREHYLQAKQRLFTSLGRYPTPRSRIWAALNADDPGSSVTSGVVGPNVDVLHFALARQGYRPRGLAFYAARRRFTKTWSRYTVTSPERAQVAIHTPLLGEFNVYNALGAITAGYCLGLSPLDIQKGMATFMPPPGRFELIGGEGKRPLVIIDYAHTPESLEQVLMAARQLGRKGRLWTVFGCGGETDPAKRPLMGAAAASLSDRIVLTNDNPRREDPAAIVAQIMAGCSTNPGIVEIMLDRAKAISHAFNQAAAHDTIVIAGRGHETEQIFADGAKSFSDREFVYDLFRYDDEGERRSPWKKS